MTETLNDLPILLFETPQDFEQWMASNYAEPAGVWLKLAKKGSGKISVTYGEALDVALCYGWVDSQKRSYDEQYFLQKFTPRRARSIWSKVNVGKIEALLAAGKMQPAGLAVVEAAKASGQWDKAYDSHSTSRVPADFQAALDARPKAKAFYATLKKANAYAILWRLQTAGTQETRQARLEKFIGMLERGETIHPVI